MPSLIDAIAKRVRAGRPYTDAGENYHPPRPPPPPPVSAAEVAAAEAQLGFPLPPLLRDIYRHVGNGGFGPGYGLIGLTGGASFHAGLREWDIVSLYTSFRYRSTRHERWGEGLLPICTWGCSYFSYLDCALPQAPVMGLDENSHGHGPWGCAFSLHAASFEEWMQRWLDGENLWESIGLSGEPIFAYEEEREDNAPVHLTRTFGAAPKTVFDAWIRPAIMRRWLFKRPGMEVERMDVDARAGGRYSMLVGKQHEAISYSGEYETIEPPCRLVFSLEAPRICEGVSRVSVDIAPVPNGSRLDLTHTGLPGRVVIGPWNYMLDALGEMLANRGN